MKLFVEYSRDGRYFKRSIKIDEELRNRKRSDGIDSQKPIPDHVSLLSSVQKRLINYSDPSNTLRSVRGAMRLIWITQGGCGIENSKSPPRDTSTLAGAAMNVLHAFLV